MDGAPYHSFNVYKVRVPTKSATKSVVQAFLRDKGIPFDGKSKKEDLLKLVKAGQLSPEYAVADICFEEGVDVLRIPPYHCYFDPIELAWAMMERVIRRLNTTPHV